MLKWHSSLIPRIQDNRCEVSNPIGTSCVSYCSQKDLFRYNKAGFVIYNAHTHNTYTYTRIRALTYLFLPLVFWHFQVCGKSFNMIFFSRMQWIRHHTYANLRSLFKF